MYKNFRESDLLKCLFIVSITTLLYFHTFKFVFQLDDFLTIVERPLIKNLGTFFDNASGIFHNRVFLLYSFALNYHVGGLNVIGYHLVNVLIHSFVSIFLYFFIKEILLSQSPSPADRKNLQIQNTHVIPFLASLLFAVHPLQTESVTYISSRSTLLVTLFFLVSLLFFAKGIRAFFNPVNKLKQKAYFVFYFLGGIFFFLVGMGFKETIILLPLVLFLYIYFFHHQRILKSRQTLISLCILLLLLTGHVAGFINYSKEIEQLTLFNQTSEYQSENFQNAFSKLKEIKKKKHPLLHSLYFSKDTPNFLTKIYSSISSKIKNVFLTGQDSYSPKTYLLTQLEVVGLYYLKILVFPFNQSVFPDFPVFNMGHWKALAGSLFIMASISVYSLSLNLKLVSFALLWYLITIMPYSSFIPLTDLVSEHRTYLPNIGFFIAVSTGLASLLSSKRHLFTLSFILTILIISSVLSLKRNYVWQSDISLWEDAFKKAPTHIKSINALGLAYSKTGEKDKAQSLFQKGLKIDPLNYSINVNIGRIFKDKGDLDRAEEQFKFAALISKDSLAHINLGYIYLKKNLYYQSIQEFNKALELKHDSHLAYFFLGNAYNKLKEYQKAIGLYKKSIELNPDYAKAYNNIGYVYWNLAKHDQAFGWFVKAMNRDADLPDPYLNIGNYFLIKGEQRQADNFYNQYKKKAAETNKKNQESLPYPSMQEWLSGQP